MNHLTHPQYYVVEDGIAALSPAKILAERDALAAKFDAQVNAGWVLFEQNERLRKERDALTAELASMTKDRDYRRASAIQQSVYWRTHHEARVAALEAALRYWSGYDDVDFAVKQAAARGELAKPSASETQGDPLPMARGPTTCWKCHLPYDIELAECLHCKAANANVDLDKAQAQRESSAPEPAPETQAAPRSQDEMALQQALRRKERYHVCPKCGQRPYDGHDMCSGSFRTETGSEHG